MLHNDEIFLRIKIVSFIWNLTREFRNIPINLFSGIYLPSIIHVYDKTMFFIISHNVRIKKSWWNGTKRRTFIKLIIDTYIYNITIKNIFNNFLSSFSQINLINKHEEYTAVYPKLFIKIFHDLTLPNGITSSLPNTVPLLHCGVNTFLY